MSTPGNPLDLVCFHVGGYGDYSHANILAQTFPKRTIYVAFEARLDDADVNEQKSYLDKGVRTTLIQKCVSDHKGREKFYINTHADSSSIYPPARRALFEHRPGEEGDLTWQANTVLDRIVELPTVTLDEVIAEGSVSAPDMLSVDAQGAELKILRGAERAIRSEILLIITEVEFHRIYEGQPLFSDQFNLLYENGFRLAEIFAQQYWHPLARAGFGLLTVGEALFLRDAEDYLAVPGVSRDRQIDKLIKLAVLAFLFGRLSIVANTLNIGAERFGPEVVERIKSVPEYGVILDVRDYINDNLHNYKRNPRFFDTSDKLIAQYGPVEELGRPSLRKIPIYPYTPSNMKEFEAELDLLRKKAAHMSEVEAELDRLRKKDIKMREMEAELDYWRKRDTRRLFGVRRLWGR